jgi:hypothetical protein
MQLNKQQIFLKMLLLLGRLAFTLNDFGLGVEGDVDAIHFSAYHKDMKKC